MAVDEKPNQYAVVTDGRQITITEALPEMERYISIKPVSDDPYHPMPRSKGEKARNRRNKR